MADQENSAPDVEYNDDGSKNPTYVPPTTDGEGADDTKNKITTDKDKDEGDDFKDEIDPANPPKIPVRLSVAQHIIARKNDKIKKLESNLKEGDEGYVPPADDDEDDFNLSDDANKAIDKKLEKAIAPLLGDIASKAEEKEMQELIASEPEAKKYLNHIKAYMEHEAYKGVSPVVIYHHLAFNSAQALGAKKKKTADLEANQNNSGGRSIVDTKLDGLPTADDISDMSDEDFAKMEEEVLQGKYLKK